MSKSKDFMEEIDKLENEVEAMVEFPEGADHKHSWALGADGSGTSSDGDHTHEVIAFIALPCTEDGHSHRIELPAANETEEWSYNA